MSQQSVPIFAPYSRRRQDQTPGPGGASCCFSDRDFGKNDAPPASMRMPPSHREFGTHMPADDTNKFLARTSTILEVPCVPTDPASRMATRTGWRNR